jgi:hypothetical protein
MGTGIVLNDGIMRAILLTAVGLGVCLAAPILTAADNRRNIRDGELPIRVYVLETLSLLDRSQLAGPKLIKTGLVSDTDHLPSIGWHFRSVADTRLGLLAARGLRIRYSPECLDADLHPGLARLGIPGWMEWLPSESVDLGFHFQPSSLMSDYLMRETSQCFWTGEKRIQKFTAPPAGNMNLALFGQPRPAPLTFKISLYPESFRLRIDIGEPMNIADPKSRFLLTYCDTFFPLPSSALPAGWRSSEDICLRPSPQWSILNPEQLIVSGLGPWHPDLQAADFTIETKSLRLRLRVGGTEFRFSPGSHSCWNWANAEEPLNLQTSGDREDISFGNRLWIRGASAPASTNRPAPLQLVIGDTEIRIHRVFKNGVWALGVNDWTVTRRIGQNHFLIEKPAAETLLKIENPEDPFILDLPRIQCRTVGSEYDRLTWIGTYRVDANE